MDIIWLNAVCNAVRGFLIQKPLLMILLMGGLLILIILGIYFLSPLLEQVRYERLQLVAADSKLIAEFQKQAAPVPEEKKQKEDTMKKPITTGDINVSGNQGPTQVNIGSPGSKQIINQHRTINPQAKIEKTQRDGEHILQIILNQTGGFWDPGTTFQINAKVSGPYKKASIVRGLPPVKFDVKIGDHKEKGEYFYSTTTAPFPDSPIVLEIISTQDINLEQLGVAPLASQ